MSSKITKSAKGKECQVRIPGVCSGDSSTVVWAHANGLASGKGIGMKSNDILGAYACQNCHDLYDMRTPISHTGLTNDKVKLYFLEGHLRSLQILINEGLVKL